MKKLCRIAFIYLLFTIYYLLFTISVDASFMHPEAERPAYTFGRSGEIIWGYESITLEGQQPFSYFSQNYRFNLWGPLIFPTLGSVRGSFDYRLGKNVLDYPWVSKTQQKLYTYNLGFSLAPPIINRFLRIDSTSSRTIRDQFADEKIVARSYLTKNQTLTVNFFPPWTINLSRLFGKNNNQRSLRRRRADNFFVFSLPRFTYSYFGSDTSDELYEKPTFHLESINQRYLTVWDFRNLRLNYQVSTKKEYDLLRKIRINETITRDLTGSLQFGPFLKVFSNLLFAGSYSESEFIYPLTPLTARGNLSTTLNSKSFALLRTNSVVMYSNNLFWRKDVGIETTKHNLSLVSYKYIGKFYLTNTVGYGITTRKDTPSATHNLTEKFTSYFTPWRPLAFTGELEQTYAWDGGKSRSEKYRGRADFRPFGFLSFYTDLTLGKTTDLLTKQVSARSSNLESSVTCSGGFSPFGWLLNGFLNNNNNNHRNHSNGLYDNLLTLTYNLNLVEYRDLLSDAVERRFIQRYTARSAPFDNYLVVNVSYERVMILDGKPVTTYEYFTLEITSQAGWLYAWRGLTFSVSIWAYNLRQLNIDLLAQYKFGASSIDLRYRILAVSGSGPYRALGLSFTRKI